MALLSSPLFLIALGLVLLVIGADWLVRGASRLALALGMTPLVIGLTVVAIGTSTPELSVSLDAALAGSPGIALGNVVGSNIANVLLILGLVAVLVPLTVSRQLVWIDVPIMIAASLATVFMAWDGLISRAEGLLLMAAAVAYIGFLIRLARRHPEQIPLPELPAAAPDGRHGWPRSVLLIVAGLGMLVFGANRLVAGATAIAASAGLSELVIGLTVVAVGTSLPEITTSLVSALRGHRDLAVGNIVGSNIFNLLLVLGGTAVLAPNGIDIGQGARSFDLPVMLAVAVACLPIFITGHQIARWEGAVFLGYYAAYVTYLLLDASGHDALDDLGLAMRWVVIPLTVLTLAISLSRLLGIRRNRGRPQEMEQP